MKDITNHHIGTQPMRPLDEVMDDEVRATAPQTRHFFPRPPRLTRTELKEGYKAVVGEPPEGWDHIKPSEEVTLSEVLAKVDEQDIAKVLDKYHTLLDSDVDKCIKMMRHRAGQLRERANQLDADANFLNDTRMRTVTANIDIRSRIDDFLNEIAALAGATPK